MNEYQAELTLKGNLGNYNFWFYRNSISVWTIYEILVIQVLVPDKFLSLMYLE